MEEQNNQNFENKELESAPDDNTAENSTQKNPLINNIKEKITSFIKNTPKKTLIIGASIIGTVIIAAIVLIIVFAGGNDNNFDDYTPSCNHSYTAEEYPEAHCSYNRDVKYICDYCGYYYYDWNAVPAIGHVWESATCTSVEKCKICWEKKDPNSQPAGHTWTEATCTENKKCSVCGKVEYSSLLGHDYSETTGTCTRCDFGVKFILPTTPTTINYKNYNGSIYKSCIIESIKIERIQESSYSTPYYKLTFIVQSTYHEKGNNYSDDACFGWKLYDEDGLVVTSGTGYTDGDIKVGEKSKETITFYIGEDRYVQYGETYRLELLNLG